MSAKAIHRLAKRCSSSLLNFVALMFVLPAMRMPAIAQVDENFGIERVGRLYNNWNTIFDVAAQGDLLYVAAGNSGLQVVDFSNPDDVKVIGMCEEGTTSLLAAAGDFVFTLDYHSYILRTIDVSDPSNPVVVARTDVDIHFYSYTLNIQDTLLYITASYAGLIQYDISDPVHPELLPGLDVRIEIGANFTTAGDLGYIHTQGLATWLITLDLSDPFHIVPRAIKDFGVVSGMRDLKYYNNYLYGIYPGIIRYDVSDPDTIIIANRLDEPFGLDWAIHDGFGYSPRSNSIAIVDIRDDEEMRLLDPIEIDSIGSGTIHDCEDGFYLAGNLNRIAGSEDKVIRRYGLEDPETIEARGELMIGGTIWDVAYYEEYLYVANGYGGVRIIDASNPSDPREVDTLIIGRSPWSLEVIDNRLIVIDDELRHFFFDIDSPESPRYLGRLSWDQAIKPLGFINGLFVGLTYESDILFFDLSDFGSPRLVASYNGEISPYDAVLRGDQLFIAGHLSGLTILDLSDLNNIRSQRVDIGGYPKSIFLQDDLTVVLDLDYDRNNLRIFDFSDSEHPELLGQMPSSTASSVAVRNSKVLFADALAGIHVVDFSDPVTPQFTGSFQTPGYAQSAVFMTDELVAVADRTNLSIYTLSSMADNPRWVERPDDIFEVMELDTVSVHVRASDPENRRLILTMQRGFLPESAHFVDLGQGEGQFEWVTNYQDNGYYHPVIIADNGETHSALTLHLFVETREQAPQFIEFPDDTIFAAIGDTLSIHFGAMDANGDRISFELFRNGLPPSARFSNEEEGSCQIDWIPTDRERGAYLPWITISDVHRVSDSLQFPIVVGRVNQAGDAFGIPDHIELHEFFPNPFNSLLSIQFSTPENISISIEVFDQTGRSCGRLFEGVSLGSQTSVKFDGSRLGSGVYIVRMQAGSEFRTKKAVLIR